MRSKAHFQGHPIHPALVHFPLAFLIGAFAFDLAGQLLAQPALWTTGAYLAAAGIVTALLAAAPGFLDYFYTVPPNSSAKRRATLHLAVNLAAVALFAAAWLLRGTVNASPSLVVLIAEGLGTVLLAVGGYQGGILVNRNQIGVDHRYAGAGKWMEARLDPDAEGLVVAASSGELEVDQMKLLHVGGRRIVLARTGHGYTAFDDRCSHRGASLADGVLISGTVQCPWHGSQFEVRTGKVCSGPAKSPIAVYPVKVKGSQVLIDLEGSTPRGGRSKSKAAAGKK